MRNMMSLRIRKLEKQEKALVCAAIFWAILLIAILATFSDYISFCLKNQMQIEVIMIVSAVVVLIAVIVIARAILYFRDILEYQILKAKLRSH